MIIEKRFQIFVSSTFKDLQEARSQVSLSILKMGHIPAGMEQFPAVDVDQFEWIKRIIDFSDYYVLILAGRYGSLAPDGKSYTEKEYDYAVEKGLPISVLLHRHPGKLPADDSETGPGAELLKAFRERVSSSRMIAHWENVGELGGLVRESIQNQLTLRPRTGWIRGDKAADIELYKKLEELRTENEALKLDAEKRKLKNEYISSELNIEKIFKMNEAKFPVKILLRPSRVIQEYNISINDMVEFVLNKGVFDSFEMLELVSGALSKQSLKKTYNIHAWDAAENAISITGYFTRVPGTHKYRLTQEGIFYAQGMLERIKSTGETHHAPSPTS